MKTTTTFCGSSAASCSASNVNCFQWMARSIVIRILLTFIWQWPRTPADPYRMRTIAFFCLVDCFARKKNNLFGQIKANKIANDKRQWWKSAKFENKNQTASIWWRVELGELHYGIIISLVHVAAVCWVHWSPGPWNLVRFQYLWLHRASSTVSE